jgi:radical SAM protein with 4Fe4S-binding SPASM domain
MQHSLIDQLRSFINFDRFRLRLPPRGRIAPGLYHFSREVDGFPSRFHLRVDPDGHGLLVANASLACHLSPSGVQIALSLLGDEEKERTFAQITQRFRGVSRPQFEEDYETIHRLITTLTAPGDNYPITNLDDPWVTPQARQLSAPLSAELALPAGEAEVEPLIRILHALWEAMIPQVGFITNAESSSATLLRLVERAEDIGMIAGVRISASRLTAEKGLLTSLAQAGVDYVTVPYVFPLVVSERLLGAGEYESAMAAFAAILTAEVCPVALVPLVRSTTFELENIVSSLVTEGVTNFFFFALATLAEMPEDDETLTAESLPQVASLVEEAAHEFNVRFLWAPPVERDSAKRLDEQVREGPRCAGDVSVRVEHDGAVIPPRGAYQVAGNILQDDWSTIWNHQAFRQYRERVASPTRCDTCPGLAICAADCPKNPEGWARRERP